MVTTLQTVSWQDEELNVFEHVFANFAIQPGPASESSVPILPTMLNAHQPNGDSAFCNHYFPSKMAIKSIRTARFQSDSCFADETWFPLFLRPPSTAPQLQGGYTKSAYKNTAVGGFWTE